MANLQISNLSQSTSDRRQALSFHTLTDSNNRHHHQLRHPLQPQQPLIASSSSSSRSPDLDNIVGNSDETSVQQPASSTPSGSACSSGGSFIHAKKRKMANENLNFSNDSGIPMEGVELDSSTVSRGTSSPTNQHLGPTNSTLNLPAGPQTNAASNLANNNEALANDSLSLSYCDETKRVGSYSPDYGAALCDDQNTQGADENSFHNNSLQFTTGNQIGHQNNSIRSFGELFDDDDLD